MARETAGKKNGGIAGARKFVANKIPCTRASRCVAGKIFSRSRTDAMIRREWLRAGMSSVKYNNRTCARGFVHYSKRMSAQISVREHVPAYRRACGNDNVEYCSAFALWKASKHVATCPPSFLTTCENLCICWRSPVKKTSGESFFFFFLTFCPPIQNSLILDEAIALAYKIRFIRFICFRERKREKEEGENIEDGRRI